MTVSAAEQIISKRDILFSKRLLARRWWSSFTKNRIGWDRTYVTFTNQDWANVIFSHEKKFSFDGRDGFVYYWHDFRTDPKIFPKGQRGGQNVLVWAAVFYKGMPQLVNVSRNVNPSRKSDWFCKVTGGCHIYIWTRKRPESLNQGHKKIVKM